MKKINYLLALLLSVTAYTQTTVFDVIAESDNHTILEQALRQEKLDLVLNEAGQFTVFAPTDEAFAALLPKLGYSTAQQLLDDPKLNSILTYHVLNTNVPANAALTLGGTFNTTVNGDSLFVSVIKGNVYVDQAKVITPDLDATNGVVHSVNEVVLPQENSIIDVAVSGGFSILTQAVVAADLAPTLINPLAELTVFAPTDEAFLDLIDALDTDAASLLANPDLADILLYHVLGAEVPASVALTLEGDFAETANGDSLFITVTSENMLYVDQAMVTNPDVLADNGIIHVIDAVVLPQENSIIDIAVSSGFSILTQAVIAADLAPTLINPLAELTVFAPTDEAFLDLIDALDTDAASLLANPDLADILLYHVLEAEVPASIALTLGGNFAETAIGDSLFLTVTSENMLYVDQAMVTNPDILADNGIIHVIDAVVLPQENSIIDVAVSGGFSILTQAVVATDLAPTLIDPLAELTVFAPTDEAFLDLIDALDTDAASLLANPDLADILLYHVLGAKIPASIALTLGGNFAETANGDSLFLTVTSENMLYVDQAMVTNPDVLADNGIIHVIDAVVLPQENSIIDVAVSGGFSILTQAVVAADLAPTLIDPLAQLTVFAPTDEAFAAALPVLGYSTPTELLADENLKLVLLHHVFNGIALSENLTDGEIPVLSDQNVTVSLTNGVFIDNAEVTTPDVNADNGLIHVINAILLPNVTATSLTLTEGDFTFYPNPIVATLTIEGEFSFIELITIDGKTVLTSSTNLIDTTDLASGSYILKVHQDGKTYTSHILVK